jgi:prephenate dehydrogenase
VAQETPDLYANVQTKVPGLRKMEESFIQNAQEWVDLMKKKDSAEIMARMDRLRSKLAKVDGDYGKSYETMYRMLEATEKDKA